MDDRSAAEARFASVFAHLGLITSYARRRGAHDPDEIAAEAMAIAWRRLADVPVDDARPWLIATARNLLRADRRRRGKPVADLDSFEPAAPAELPAPAVDLDPELERALRSLSAHDREALLLVAWEDLTPTAAAASLGISAAAFRVRLHRARRRLLFELESRAGADNREPSMEQI
ncbi:MAG TPA: sigma-70 family RNA polymerase sigma factor [Solirubrobacteraceae bacterium]|jgi:RNA polymerase sigma-70 factor (ECF subfamily)|nr:sigma-70 family RNA polymerase sigma factor [Solirubrobacteraceae bacterium]